MASTPGGIALMIHCRAGMALLAVWAKNCPTHDEHESGESTGAVSNAR
jgi:hypothetical protein